MTNSIINIKEDVTRKDILHFRSLLVQAILYDEKEYCFDKSYVSDDSWKTHANGKTREQAYIDVVQDVFQTDTASLLKQRNGQYDYLFEMEDVKVTKRFFEKDLC